MDALLECWYIFGSWDIAIIGSHATGRFGKTGNFTITTGRFGNSLKLNDFGPKWGISWELEEKNKIFAHISDKSLDVYLSRETSTMIVIENHSSWTTMENPYTASWCMGKFCMLWYIWDESVSFVHAEYSDQPS